MIRCPECFHDNPAGYTRCERCDVALPQPLHPVALPPKLEQQIKNLLEEGDKIGAIKLYRAHTGAWLKESKDAVEAIGRGEPLRPREHGGEVPTDEIRNLLQADRKIDAIKLYRARTGAGLKEAKDEVERLQAELGLAVDTQSGCLGLVVLVLLAIALTSALDLLS